jgi:purine-nucleoside phosphorylase
VTGQKALIEMTELSPERLFDTAAEALIARGVGDAVECAFVLGTGLGRIAEDLTDAISIPYADIPGFPEGDVSGHARQLWYGKLEGRRVLILQGRAHFYETGDSAVMRVPIGVLTRLGNPPLILTNAAGSTRQTMKPGALVLISDHINFSGPNPLIGDPGDGRFVSMTDAYDPRLRLRIRKAASAAGINLHEGVYMWFSGPSFETPAEVRMAMLLGADLVGMSTVPETILARRYGLRVAGISTVTNLAAGIEGASPSHTETRDVAASSTASLRRIFRALMTGLYDG